MQHSSAPDHPNRHLEMSLREHLLAAGASGSGPAPYPPASGPATGGEHAYPPGDAASPHEPFDPSSGAPPYGIGSEDHAEDSPGGDARKGKRELSTSKRAAQNRAAQRAFRQRKEGYIKKLEEQVKEFESMEQGYRALQAENYQLREYILNLQSRLLENQSDFPPPPTQASLPPSLADRGDRSSAAVDHQLRREMETPSGGNPIRHDAMSQLQAAAAQASNAQADGSFGAADPKRGRSEDASGVVKAGS